MAGVEKTTQNLRKCLRPSEIIKSNKIVESLVKTMREQFTHPFDASFEKDKLYNIVSGKPVSDDICQSLSSIMEIGTTYYEEFQKRLTGESEKKLFDRLKRNNQRTFKHSVEKISVQAKDKTES